MGWDCTLHVVDDASFARFSARFLRGLYRDGAFDQQYDGDDLIGKVKQLIAENPDTGAGALGELALLFVSTETPHVYCRNFALSLWDEQVMGAPLPAKWLGTIESRLPDILAAYPKLATRVPRILDRNYCVGPLVTARDVPALLAHVETALAAMPASDRARYRPLRDILKLAAARGLGYWEGTDIDVTQAHVEWLAVAPPKTLQVVPHTIASPHARPIAVDGNRILVADFFVLHEVDTSTFPPKITTHDGLQVTAAAFTPRGTTFARMATDRTARPFKFAYYELPDRTPLAIEPAFPIGFARPLGDALLLFPQATSDERSGLTPLVLRDAELTPLKVPAPPPTRAVDCATIPFGDGSLLVVWDALPYRWDGKAPPVPLGRALESPVDPYAAVTLADGSIVAGFGRKLIRIDREGERTTLLPLDNVLAVALGPDDVLIISEGDHPEADAFKLWWPLTREVTHVAPEMLGLDDRAMFVYYDRTAQLLVAARADAWHAIAWDELAALPRVSEDAFRAKKTA